jgi:hypothetical protein
MNGKMISKADSQLGTLQTEITCGGSIHTPVISRIERKLVRGTKQAKAARAFFAACDMWGAL